MCDLKHAEYGCQLSTTESKIIDERLFRSMTPIAHLNSEAMYHSIRERPILYCTWGYYETLGQEII